MKLADAHPMTSAFGLLVQAFSGQPQPYAGAPALASNGARASAAAGSDRPGGEPGWFARLGEWIFRRQLRGTRFYLKEPEDIFADLDRWLWKQHVRETEAWLAKSHDVYELEARIRELERGRGRSAL